MSETEPEIIVKKSNKQKIPKTLNMKQEPTPEPQQFIEYNEPEPIVLDSPERKNILAKLERYQQNFQDKAKYKLDSLRNKSDDELKAILNETRNSISNNNGMNLFKTIGITGINLLEQTGPIVGLKLQGLTSQCATNQVLDNIWTELQCEYGSFTGYQPPHIRLLFTVGLTAYKVHTINSMNIEQQPNSTIKPEVANQYNDL